MYFKDLGTKCDIASGADIRAIGFLSKGKPFPEAPVPHRFLDILKEHRANAWLPVVSPGLHECELCGSQPAADTGHILVPVQGVLFVAPAMVVHYIESHGYRPPDQFVEAVMSCPPQGSPGYHVLMKPFLHHWSGPAVDETGQEPEPQDEKESVTWIGILFLLVPAAVVTAYFLVWPDSTIFSHVANATVLMTGSFLLSSLAENIGGQSRYSMPCLMITATTVLGAVLFGLYGWIATACVLGGYAAYAVAAGLMSRSA